MAQITRQEDLKVSFQYINWILRTNRAIMCHLYQFTAADGTNSFYTDLDVDVTNVGVDAWISNSLRFEGPQRKLSIGLAVDEQTIKIWAAPTDTMFGSRFLQGAQSGLLDGAVITRFRAVWKFDTGNAAVDVRAQPLAVWPLFTGYMGQVTKGGATHVEMKVKSALVRLNVNMPRNYYQPGCLWTLFSSGCTLNKALFAESGTVTGIPTSKVIPVLSGVPVPVGSDGIATFAQGRLLWTSGNNTDLLCLIDTNDATTLTLAYPLADLPQVGDTFTYYPGCSKSHETCQVKFANEANYRGFDKVPPIVVSA